MMAMRVRASAGSSFLLSMFFFFGGMWRLVQIREGWIGSDKRRVFIVLEGMTITYMESCGGYLWFVMAISDDQHFTK